MQKPLSVLNANIRHKVIVELKAGREYRGTLDGFDPHMNIVLKNAEERMDDDVVRKFDIAILRGDNVVYISP